MAYRTTFLWKLFFNLRRILPNRWRSSIERFLFPQRRAQDMLNVMVSSKSGEQGGGAGGEEDLLVVIIHMTVHPTFFYSRMKYILSYLH